MSFGWIVPVVLVILVLVVLISNIHVVQQSRAYVVERLGAFYSVWNVGLHFKVPFIMRVAKKVSLKEQVAAYANGWFQQIFSARSETPLSSEQIQYIQNNEQIVGQSQTINDWTVDLKSTICDGRTGYLVFQITAPDGIDLEQYLNPPTVDDKRLSPGNYSL